MHVFTVSRAIELKHGDAELVEACQQSPVCNISGGQRNVTSPHHHCSRLSFWSHCHGAHSFHRLPLRGGGAKDEGPLVLVHLVLCPLQVMTSVSLALDPSMYHFPTQSPLCIAACAQLCSTKLRSSQSFHGVLITVLITVSRRQ